MAWPQRAFLPTHTRVLVEALGCRIDGLNISLQPRDLVVHFVEAYNVGLLLPLRSLLGRWGGACPTGEQVVTRVD